MPKIIFIDGFLVGEGGVGVADTKCLDPSAQLCWDWPIGFDRASS